MSSKLLNIDKIIDKLSHTKPNFGEDSTKERYRYMQWLADINAIKELKPEREYTEWTPVSERLPNENGSYLVQYCSFDKTARIKFMTVDHYNVEGSWLHEEKNKKVEAWMPLPEPYKGSKVGWSSLENIREKVGSEVENEN